METSYTYIYLRKFAFQSLRADQSPHAILYYTEFIPHPHITSPIMSYTLYDATILHTKNALSSLSNILKEAESHANASSFP
jgi:hypothetical protein